MKVRIFENAHEEDINNWLEGHPDMRIFEILQSYTPKGLFITIFYDQQK